MSKTKSILDKVCTLEKFDGKGGWTYARIPEILSDKSAPFGWVKVRGYIDGYAIRKYHLMPMGNGMLFLPVKVDIRRAIKKEAGDTVHVILYPDDEPLEIPQELQLCLADDPEASAFFDSISESEKKYYINWIYSAKKEETRVARLVKTLDRLARKLKMYDKASSD